MPAVTAKDDIDKNRFPYCIVWTPLPPITWIFPFIGHIGICYSNGVIRDFAGPYFVSEDNMAFGRPTRLLRLDKNKIKARSRVNGAAPANTSTRNVEAQPQTETSAPSTNLKPITWDSAVYEASEIYKTRMHNICCDNCHSHVCTVLEIMQYNGESWNMVKLALLMFFTGEYVSFGRAVYTWLPFLIILSVVAVVVVFAR